MKRQEALRLAKEKEDLENQKKYLEKQTLKAKLGVIRQNTLANLKSQQDPAAQHYHFFTTMIEGKQIRTPSAVYRLKS